MVWLIRAIINGNIIIQASISKRSHLNEYIFCLGAVAAREPLKRKERGKKENKNQEKPLVQSLGGWGRKKLTLGIRILDIWGGGVRFVGLTPTHSMTLDKTLSPTSAVRGGTDN